MTNYKFGDIVIVPFPFTDQTTTKKRPAVVISSAAYHYERPDLILMAITSQIRGMATVGEVIIHSWQEAGLIKPSIIKPVLATIERGLVIEKRGELSEDDQRDLKKALTAIMGQ